MASRDPDRERHWRSVLTQWHQSDQTIAAFCQQRHLSKPAFGHTPSGRHQINVTNFMEWAPMPGFASAAGKTSPSCRRSAAHHVSDTSPQARAVGVTFAHHYINKRRSRERIGYPLPRSATRRATP
jgi:hypothetical protein